MKPRPMSADVRVLPACAVVRSRTAAFTYHRISERKQHLPQFVERWA